MDKYQMFLDQKRILDKPSGLESIPKLNEHLFDWQRDCVAWALRRGRAALFEDCGLGKTIQELEWARQISIHTGGPVLILTPLVVGPQMRDEGTRFSILTNLAESDADVKWALCPDTKPYKGIYITNYEKLHRFDTSKFTGVVLDESSILKSFDGKTRTQLIEAFKHTPYKLAATATPAPNDFMEIGNHAEFLGIMSRAEMLSMFFVHDGGDTSKWRLKGHAESDFWQWMCSWAINLRKPSDIGYSDKGYDLPPLHMTEHIISANYIEDGSLFPMPASTLSERRDTRRKSLSQRVDHAVSIARSKNSKSIIWCNLNDEQDALESTLGDSCVSIRGATNEEDRIKFEQAWRLRDVPFIITKPDIFGWGINWQHCHREIFCGISDSFEMMYQAIRRCWRFGQEQPVEAHLILSNAEQNVLRNIKRKQQDAERMASEMVSHMSDISKEELRGVRRSITEYNPTIKMTKPTWLK